MPGLVARGSERRGAEGRDGEERCAQENRPALHARIARARRGRRVLRGVGRSARLGSENAAALGPQASAWCRGGRASR